MITNINLEGEYRVINCTRNSRRAMVGAKVIGNEISVGEKMQILKNDKIKEIEVDSIFQVRENRYKIKNSNYCLIIKKK